MPAPRYSTGLLRRPGNHEDELLKPAMSDDFPQLLLSRWLAMNSTTSLPEELHSLPQYGFGAEETFDALVSENPFLFRVYTPKQRMPFVDNPDPFFVAPCFNGCYTMFPERLSSPSSKPRDLAATATYDDVVQHMSLTTRSSSPYISTSFSFVWALWEAVRRYRVNMKHDIEIAIIDAQAVAGHAVTAAEVLRKGLPTERHADHDRWYRFAMESQDVLVYESIPGTAIYTSLPLLCILKKLPSYFLRSAKDSEQSLFDRLAWDPLTSKPSYRQFCQEISERFLDLPTEVRLRDTTVGSVRLAMALLRQWLREFVSRDLRMAKSTLCKLSYVIAQWPGHWWTRDHSEMWDLIRATTQVLFEEMQEQEKLELEESRLMESVSEPETLVRHFGLHSSCIGCTFPRMRTMSWSGLSATSDTIDARSVHTLVEVVEPPDLPESLDEKKITKLMAQLEFGTQTSPVEPAAYESKAIGARVPPSPSPSVLSHSSIETISSDASTESEEDEPEEDFAAKPEEDKAVLPLLPEPTNVRRRRTAAETASFVVTAFLGGAFIALCIMSSQRRVLARGIY